MRKMSSRARKRQRVGGLQSSRYAPYPSGETNFDANVSRAGPVVKATLIPKLVQQHATISQFAARVRRRARQNLIGAQRNAAWAAVAASAGQFFVCRHFWPSRTRHPLLQQLTRHAPRRATTVAPRCSSRRARAAASRPRRRQGFGCVSGRFAAEMMMSTQEPPDDEHPPTPPTATASCCSATAPAAAGGC